MADVHLLKHANVLRDGLVQTVPKVYLQVNNYVLSLCTDDIKTMSCSMYTVCN